MTFNLLYKNDDESGDLTAQFVYFTTIDAASEKELHDKFRQQYPNKKYQIIKVYETQ